MITEQDKVRARHHLGYLGVAQASTFVLGVPAAVQTQFVAEGAFTKILPSTEAFFRTLLDRLDALECQLVEDAPNLAVTRVDEIELSPDEFKRVMKLYFHWQGAVANLLGVPPNPFDQRFSTWSGGGGINAAVIN